MLEARGANEQKKERTAGARKCSLSVPSTGTPERWLRTQLDKVHYGKTLRKGTGGAARKGRACQVGFNSRLPDKSELVQAIPSGDTIES